MSELLKEADRYREPGTMYISPRLVCERLEMSVNGLAKRAGVGRNTPRVRPGCEKLQRYLRQVVAVLVVAEQISDDYEAVGFWYMNSPLVELDYWSADKMVTQGRADALLAYLAMLSAGSTG